MNVLHKSFVLLVLFLLLPSSQHPGAAQNQSEESPIPVGYQRSEADLKHGEIQLRAMLAERPRMAAVVKEGSPIWIWTRQQFAGAGAGYRVFWSSDPPTSGCDAEHINRATFNYFCPSISVLDKDKLSRNVEGERQWAAAIYEFYNILNDSEFREIRRAAIAGKLSKSEWIRRTTRLEYRAALWQSSFYQHYWIRNVGKGSVPTNNEWWFQGIPRTYEAWISQYRDPSGYPYDVWGKYWTKDIEPRLKERRVALPEGP